MATYDISPWLATPIAVLICLIAGGLVALPALRVRGMYLALVTLSVGIIFPSLVRRFESLTGGSSGLFGIDFPAPDTTYFVGRAGQTVWVYWVVLGALVVSMFVVWAVMNSRMGRAVVSLRDNETAAVVMGVNRVWTRTALFSISAAIAGLGGAMFALKSGLITPETFSLILTIDLLVAMVLGGSGSHLGPVLGGLVLYFAPSWTADLGGGPVSGVLFGAVVLALVFVLPSGIAGGARTLAIGSCSSSRICKVGARRPRPTASRPRSRHIVTPNQSPRRSAAACVQQIGESVKNHNSRLPLC